MQISAQNLLASIKDNPAQAEKIIKNSLELIGTIKGSEQKNLEQINKLLDKLFLKLSKGDISKAETVKTIQKSPVFKSNSQPIADLKELITLASKEPKLSKFLAPLKSFLKDISSSNANTLKTQVQNSGIGLEAKLQKQSIEPKLPHILNQKLKTILENKPHQDILKQKDIPKLIKTLLSKEKSFIEDLKPLKEALNDVLKEIKPPQKEIPKAIENLKNIQILSTKEKVQINSFDVKTIVKQLKKDISFLQNTLKTIPNLTIKEQVLNLIKDMQSLIKTLQTEQTSQAPQMTNALQNTQTVQTIQTQLSQTQPSQNLTTQEKLKLLSNKLELSLKILKPKALEHVKQTNTIKQTLNQLNQTKLPSTQTNSIAQDIKNSLLNIEKHSSQKDSANLEKINNLSTKTLANIEANQLLSYANNSISTNIPYLWEGLREGRIAFKKGQEDSFFCQIDLEFKVYGRVNLMLMLNHENYVTMSIGAEKEEFENKIKENLNELKKSFSKQGISLQTSIKPFKNESKYQDGFSEFNMDLKA